MRELEAIKGRVEGHTEGPWVIAADVPTWESEEGSFDVGPDDAPTVAVVEGMANADLIAAAPKLIAALEAVAAVIAEHEARVPFPDADEISKAYSLGKQHGYERVQFEIAEALQ